MSRIERIFKRSHLKKFEKVLKRGEQQAYELDLSAKGDKLSFPQCRECTAPLLAGFGDSSGDYYVCLSCGAVIPVDSKDRKE